MMKNIALSRPAMSAIAAFMVLSTPSAFAQEAPTITMTPPVVAPTPQTPPTVGQPSAPAPVAAPQAAQPPVAAPVIRVPLDIAPAETAVTPRSTARAAAPARTQRTAERVRPAAAVAAAPVAAAPVGAAAAPAAEIVPTPAPAVVPVEAVAPTAPPPVAATAVSADDFPWEIAGGAAALLIVGGAGFAFARRRRVNRVVIDEAPAYEAPIAREPAVLAKSVTADSQSWITPAYAPHAQTALAPRTTPAFAAAPSGSMGRHEAIAMAGPTPDNPFATLNKRLKRARFMDRQERVAYDDTLGQQKDLSRTPVSAWEIAQRPAPAMQEQDVRRAEPARPRTTTTFRPGYSNS